LQTAYYAYPGGQLQAVVFSFSPQDTYRFDGQGNLLQGTVSGGFWDHATPEKKVSEVGQRLLRANHVTEKIAFFVEHKRDVVNAAAREDYNHVSIAQGLLAYFNTDDDLAAVLAHEIAHIVMRNQTDYPKPTEEDMLRSVLRLPAEPKQDLTRYDREQQKELDADRFGIRMLVRAGYQPEAMLRVIQVVASDGSNLWRTHPVGQVRLNAIQATLKRIHAEQTAATAGSRLK
jgi:predicted Zn-dependent protease